MATTAPLILAPDHQGVQSAADLLRDGRLVAFPTETVYGLGGDATSDTAVAAIFGAKGRPAFNPLIVHFPDTEAAWSHVSANPQAEKLANVFWPGPLTMVLPRRMQSPLSLLVSAGLDTVAIRVPAHGIAHELLVAVGRPIAAPSANRSGSISPTQAAHVCDSLGDRVDAIIDGGPCEIGIESTVVAFDGERGLLLRPGGLARADLEAVIGPIECATGDDEAAAPRSPGMLKRHYAPDIPVRLNAVSARAGEVLLGFGADTPDGALNLSKTGDVREAAANLFAMLRQLDCLGTEGIAVMPIPDTGLGIAINDRLRRATTPESP